MRLSLGAALQKLSEGVRGAEPYDRGFFEPLIDCAYKGHSYMPVRTLGDGDVQLLRNNGIKVRVFKSNGREQMVLIWGGVSDAQIMRELKKEGLI